MIYSTTPQLSVMKKIVYLFPLLISLASFSQSKKWFASISSGFATGGPSGSLKSQMNKQGFNETSNYNFLGWTGTTQYPVKNETGNFLVRFGTSIHKARSLFFVAGIADQATVTGFKNTGYSSFLGIIGGSNGPMPTVRYTLYQLTGGFMYAAAKTRAKLGFGSTLYLLQYAINDESKKMRVVPGSMMTGRFPLGKEKKLFGVELVLDLRLALPVALKQDVKPEAADFHPGKVSMIGGTAGIAFCFRN